MKTRYDLIVAGGGMSGVAAAVAAAREGLTVLLVERYGFLGGMATAGLVNPFMCYWVREEHSDPAKRDLLSQGLFTEILDRLHEMDGYTFQSTTFDEEAMKLVLARMLEENNVELLFHSFVCDVRMDNGRIQYITVANKAGLTRLEADYFVDATGDGDVATLAGCRYEIGNEDGYAQPMTMCFRIAQAELEYYHRHRKEVLERYNQYQAEGKIQNPRENILTFPHVADGFLHFNSTRIIKKSAVNPEDLTQAELEVREQAYELYHFFKENVPGFERSKLVMTACQIGVRESRRITGHYTITEEDILEGRKFEDAIACGNYDIDIHNPSGTGTVIKSLPLGSYYTIPYRAMVPLGVDNLVIAGRPISATHAAHSSYRILPICTCIGEAAGAAAALARGASGSFLQVDPRKLQELLRSHGARVD